MVEEAIAEEDGGDCQSASNTDGEEYEARLFSGEMVDGFENVREGGEEGEENGEVECYVEGEEGDDGFGEEHMKGPDESDCQEELEFCFLGWERRGLWWEVEFLVSARDYCLLIGLAGNGG